MIMITNIKLMKGVLKMKARKVMQKLHLWLSLATGVIIALICLTGSVLLFKHEINRLMYPEMYTTTPGPVISYQEAAEKVRAAYPDHQIDWLQTHHDGGSGGMYAFWIKDDKDVWQNILMDPGSGKILGDMETNGFLHLMNDIHAHLLLEDHYGNEIVTNLGLIMLFLIISGIYLWWPGLKDWVQGFKLRRNKGAYLLNYDIHKVLGAVFIPVLLAVSLTGACFFWADKVAKVFGYESAWSEPAEEVITVKPLPQGTLSLDKIAAISEAAIPGSKTTWLRVPNKPEEGKPETAFDTWLLGPGFNAAEWGDYVVYVDQYSGKVLYKKDMAAMGLYYEQWMFPLHVGSFLGFTGKVIWAVGGVIPSVLIGTGLYMWVYKRNKKKKADQQRVIANAA